MQPAPCYRIVAAVAFVLTVVELLLRLGSGVGFALRVGWAWLLVVVNVAFALGVYFIVVEQLAAPHGLVVAPSCGLLSTAALRSRLTFFRAGSKDDINAASLSFPLERIYTELQQKCYRGIDSREAVRRALKAKALAEKWPEEKLGTAIEQIIVGRQIGEERQRDEKFLRDTLKVADDGKRHYQLAMFLVDIAAGKEDELPA